MPLVAVIVLGNRADCGGRPVGDQGRAATVLDLGDDGCSDAHAVGPARARVRDRAGRQRHRPEAQHSARDDVGHGGDCAHLCRGVLRRDPADSRLAARRSSAPFADAVRVFWGDGAASLLALFAFISGFGALNGWILIQGEMPRVLAKEKVFPDLFAHESRHRTPDYSLFITSALVTIVMLMNYSGSMVKVFTLIILISTSAYLVMYLFCSLAALKLAWRGDLGIKGRRLAWLLAVAMLAALYSAVDAVRRRPRSVLVGHGAVRARPAAVFPDEMVATPPHRARRRRGVLISHATRSALRHPVRARPHRSGNGEEPLLPGPSLQRHGPRHAGSARGHARGEGRRRLGGRQHRGMRDPSDGRHLARTSKRGCGTTPTFPRWR